MEQNHAWWKICATQQGFFLLAQLYFVALFLTNRFTDKEMKRVVFLSVTSGIYEIHSWRKSSLWVTFSLI